MNEIFPRIILGLDISTACIGACVIVDNGTNEVPEIKILTHKSPKISNKIKGIESLFLRKKIFEEEFLKKITDIGITDVIIEEPLLSSNNVNTVATLLRFNGMISDSIYNILGIVPNFISSYDARMYSFPELLAIRKYNKKGKEYPLSHIVSSLKKNNLTLFGAYPFDIDKKTVMMNMVNQIYKDIPWVLNKKGELKKENFDACDSLICALAYVNINRYGIEQPFITGYSILTNEIDYEFSIWGKRYQKRIILNNYIIK